MDHGGGEGGEGGDPGIGSDPRGAQRGRLGSGRGSAAAERRQEAAGGGGSHPAGQAQVGTGVEGSREEEVGREAGMEGAVLGGALGSKGWAWSLVGHEVWGNLEGFRIVLGALGGIHKL